MLQTFHDIYLGVCETALSRQALDGAMPPGHNGPYHDPETPVRNTSHYLIAFEYAWRQTGKPAFRRAASKCLDYLLSEKCPYRQGYTFHHRRTCSKDACNGLIGPAWNMEALLAASALPRGEEARNLARELFLLHPFNESLRLWHRVEPDGRVLSPDETLNHQLWFAAAAAPLMADTAEAERRINQFIEGLAKNWAVSMDGRVIHSVWCQHRRWRERIKRLVRRAYHRQLTIKEIGYHAFNLYALAMLANQGVTWSAAVSRRLKRATAYLAKAAYVRGIDASPYGFAYNPPGWEVAYAMEVFAPSGSLRTIQEWVQRQIDATYDPRTRTFCRNNPDPETLTARVYECARLSDAVMALPVKVGTEADVQ